MVHAPTLAIEEISNAAALPQWVIAMISHIIQTCRACRAWAMFGPGVTPSVELIDKQNVEVEADILFYVAHVRQG